MPLSSNDLDVTELHDFVNAKIPDGTQFRDLSKTTVVAGLGPKVKDDLVKLSANTVVFPIL